MTHRSILLALLSMTPLACGVVVSPVDRDAAGDASPADRPDDTVLDADAGRDVVGDASTDAADAGDTVDAADAHDADAVVDVVPLPVSRLMFLDTALRRSTELERVEAVRIDPSGGGSWRRERSGGCFVETSIQPTFTRFADALEVRQLSPEQAPFFAELLADQKLRWRSFSNIFSSGDRLRITARRSDWPTEWVSELTTPVSVIVSEPTSETYYVSYTQPLQFRWDATGVAADAVVRVSALRFAYRGRDGFLDEWRLQCDFEPWRGRGSIRFADHPAFPMRGVAPSESSAIIRVDTVLTHTDRLPNGEAVLIETVSNARSIAPTLTP
jgi:hypothetical protein